MGRGIKTWSVLLIFSLLLGVVAPFVQAQGTSSIEIINLYTPSVNELDENGVPKDLDKVTRATSKNLSVQGYFYNYPVNEVLDFYYSVSNITYDQPPVTVVYDKNRPEVVGNNFTFNNVVLTEGLNKIVIYSANKEPLAEGWVYYYPASAITDLRVSYQNTEMPFENDRVYPAKIAEDDLRDTKIVLTGYAMNATDVYIQVLGDTTPYNGYFNSESGFFQFIIDKKDSKQLADIYLDGGAQEIDIIATNNTQKVNIHKRFIYNDGSSFTYNNYVAMVPEVSTTPLSWKSLLTSPVLQGKTESVNLKGTIKVEMVPEDVEDKTSPMVLQYDQVDLNISGLNNVTYSLTENSGAVTATVPNTLNAIITYNANKSNEQYKIFDYEIIAAKVDINTRKQNVRTTFSNTNPLVAKPKTISSAFDYIDQNIPYLSEVKIVKNNTALVDNTQIHELPLTIEVISNSSSANFDGVNIYYLEDGVSKPLYKVTDPTNVDSTSIERLKDAQGNELNQYKIKWLPEGIHTLKFVPYIIDGSNIAREKDAGSISRTIQYVHLQYILLTNVYNGQMFDSTGNIKEIKGRLVNIPDATNVEVNINGKISATGNTPNSGPLQFTVKTDQSFTITGVDQALEEGKNSIVFYIKDDQNSIISSSSWDIYIFTKKVPSISLSIAPSMLKDFIRTDNMPVGQYVTRKSNISIVGNFEEATKITVNIYRKGETTKTGIWGWKQIPNSTSYSFQEISRNFNNTKDDLSILSTSDDKKGTFYLDSILTDVGATTIEVQVSNPSGIIRSTTFEIQRDPLPYEIIYPDLSQTNVINSNFLKIEMLAEGADQVIFKDGAAKKAMIGNQEGFVYEVRELKQGKNKISFEVIRGDQSLEGELEVFYAAATVEGAMYKSPIEKRMKVFGDLVQLEFEKGTMLKINDGNAAQPYLTDQRQILFGIADQEDGRVDKRLYPTPSYTATSFLEEPTGRFRPASPLVWMDAGVIYGDESGIEETIYGSGLDPYDSEARFYNRLPQYQLVPTKRGQLTLKYNQYFRNDSWPYLTVYHFTYDPDKKRNEWKNIGGVVDPKKQTITVPFDGFGYYQVMYMNQSYDDVIGHNWARLDLDTLYSKGIMVNKFYNQFVPEESITRGEFVTLLVKSLELPLDYEGMLTFYDVLKYPRTIGNPLYDYKYIETAARYGIVRGRLEGTFAPNELISRQDAAVMIARATNLKLTSVTDEKQVEKTKKNLQKLFTDGNIIMEDLYAAPAVESVVRAKLMAGKPNLLLEGQKKLTYRFDPRSNLKRSEAARIVMNVLKGQKKIPK